MKDNHMERFGHMFERYPAWRIKALFTDLETIRKQDMQTDGWYSTQFLDVYSLVELKMLGAIEVDDKEVAGKPSYFKITEAGETMISIQKL